MDFAKGVYVQRIGNVQYGNVTTPPGSNGTSIPGKNRWIISYNAKKVATSGTNAPMLCSMVSVGTADNAWGCVNSIAVSTGGAVLLYLEEISGMTASETLAWLNDKQMKILYVLAEENHIPLSAEELAQYAALHTNYPNTTIFNDAGTGMEIKYVADTKSYIDKKFSLLVTNSNNA